MRGSRFKQVHLREIPEDLRSIDSLADAFAIAKHLTGNSGTVEKLLFRGQSDFSWGAIPSVYRETNFFNESITRPGSINEWVKGVHAVEGILVDRFFQRAAIHLNNPERSFIGDRILAQHFGVPTRLLDWSFNPLTAIYFAVSNPDQEDVDGSIFCCYPANRYLRLPGNTEFSEQDVGEMTMIDPPYIDQRIPAQSAALTIHAIDDNAKRFVPLEEQKLGAISGAWVTKIRIPANAKGSIYRELLQVGVDNHSMYPDLQGLGEQIRRDFLLRTY